MRRLCVVLACSALLASVAPRATAQAPDEPVVWRDAALEDALVEFAEVAGVEIVFAARLVDQVRVSGTYAPGSDPDEALQILLDGTGLRAERVRRGQYVLIQLPPVISPTGDPLDLLGTLEGRVVDAETGEALWGAHVWLVDLDLGGVVGPEGDFAVEALPTGTYTVRVSHVGYRPVRVELSVFPASPQLPPTVRLRSDGVRSDGEAVVRPPPRPPPPEPGLAVVRDPGRRRRPPLPSVAPSGPALGDDLLNALALPPSVTRSTGGPLSVRGTDPGRVFVVRDGVPLYGGLLLGYGFRPESVGEARLHRGLLPVDLDGSLGAVVDIESRQEPETRGAVVGGLGGGHAALGARLGERVSVHAGGGSLRAASQGRGRVGQVGGGVAVDPAALGDGGVRLRDLDARIVWRPALGQELSVGAVQVDERLAAGETPELRSSATTEAVSARYRGLVGSEAFVTALAYHSRLRASEKGSGTTASRLLETGARIDVDRVLGRAHQLRIGASVADRRTRRERVGGPEGAEQDLVARVYVRDSWKPSARVELRPGVHLAYVGGRATVEPRLHGRWSAVPERVHLRVGVGRQVQGVQRPLALLRDGVVRAATRPMLAGGAVPLASGWRFGAGGEWQPSRDLVVSADAFARAAGGVLLPTRVTPGPLPVDAGALASVWAPHDERAVGVELGAVFRAGAWAVRGGYGWTSVRVRREGAADWERSPFARAHALTVGAERSVGAAIVGLFADASSGAVPIERRATSASPEPWTATVAAGAEVPVLRRWGADWELTARVASRLAGPSAGAGGAGDVLGLAPLGRTVVPTLALRARW